MELLLLLTKKKILSVALLSLSYSFNEWDRVLLYTTLTRSFAFCVALVLFSSLRPRRSQYFEGGNEASQSPAPHLKIDCARLNWYMKAAVLGAILKL